MFTECEKGKREPAQLGLGLQAVVTLSSSPWELFFSSPTLLPSTLERFHLHQRVQRRLFSSSSAVIALTQLPSTHSYLHPTLSPVAYYSYAPSSTYCSPKKLALLMFPPARCSATSQLMKIISSKVWLFYLSSLPLSQSEHSRIVISNVSLSHKRNPQGMTSSNLEFPVLLQHCQYFLMLLDTDIRDFAMFWSLSFLSYPFSAYSLCIVWD